MASRIHKETDRYGEQNRCHEFNSQGATIAWRWNQNHADMIEPIIAKGNRFDGILAEW